MIPNILQTYQSFRNNPAQLLCSRFNIPQNINMNNPNDIIQYLLNSGQISQQQVNSIMGMRNNPVIQQLMQKKL